MHRKRKQQLETQLFALKSKLNCFDIIRTDLSKQYYIYYQLFNNYITYKMIILYKSDNTINIVLSNTNLLELIKYRNELLFEFDFELIVNSHSY